MNRRVWKNLLAALGGACVWFSGPAGAHSASDAYLTLDARATANGGGNGSNVVHGQWDIALRDLEFVLGLDDNGDGNIDWAELRRHQAAIARYAYANLKVSGDHKACTIKPTRQMVVDHADGAYAALFFDIECASVPKRLLLDYRLFFAIDPSHRGIFVLHAGSGTATSLLSHASARIEFNW